MKRKRIGIIGGGAAGMLAAIGAVKEGADVTILEKNERIGKKILMTGNGKCNLSNLDFSIEAYHSTNLDRVFRIFERFTVEETIHLFEAMGLFVKEKNGYLYPASEQASAVLDVLRYELHYSGVHIITDATVSSIKPKTTKNGEPCFTVICKKDTYEFDSVIIACGSKACPKTGSDGMGYTLAKQFGHKIIKPVPALVQLKCKEDFFKAIAGVRCDATLQLLIDDKEIVVERGELQLTDYGVSGIPVFQLSRFASYGLEDKKKVQILIDFLPDVTEADLEKIIKIRYAIHNDRTVEEFTTGTLNKKLAMLFIKLAGLKSNELVSNIKEEQIVAMFMQMKNLAVTVTETNSFANAQVCAGGVSMNEVKDTMESMLVPDLFFAGEVLDVDGRCGGYNLQWAWASGCMAGYHSTK